MPLSKITGNSFSTSANTNVDNGTFFVDVTNNRVGVGLANPTQTLDVARKFTVDTTNTFGKVSLARYTDSGLSSYLQGTDATGLANGLYLAYGGGSAQGIAFDGGNIVFYNNTNTTERIRITDAGVLQLANGQIKFPASQQASADANTLDDYEEGTYTPIFVGVGGSNPTIGYASQVGRYLKIGNTVLWQAMISWTSKSGGSGTLGISLPFQVSGVSGYYPTMVVGYSTGFSVVTNSGYTDPAQSNMFFKDYNAGGGNQTTSVLGSSGHVMCSGHYTI